MNTIMPETIGGAIGSIISTAFKLGTLVRGIANAPHHIHRICAEAETCRAVVVSLKILLFQIEKEGGDQIGQELIYVSNLANTLFGCQETLGLVEKELEDLMKENMSIGKDERARWVWREQEIKELLARLDAHKLTLNLTLNVLNCHQAQEIRKQNAEILNYIHSIQGPASAESATCASPFSRFKLLSEPNEQKQPSLSLGTISEHEDVETVQRHQNNLERAAADPSSLPTFGLSTATANSAADPITFTPISTTNWASTNPTASTSTYSVIVSGLTLTEVSSFEQILFASKVYQRRSAKRNIQARPSDITWSELHHSGASIFSYSLRRRTSLSIPILISVARLYLRILWLLLL